MKVKSMITFALLAFVIASIAFFVSDESRQEKNSDSAENSATGQNREENEKRIQTPQSGEPDHKVIVYYFHGNKRCVTCRKIEAYTTETIKTAFPSQLKSGELELHIVNTDKPRNQHFIYDYKLSTKSVILAEYHNGQQTRWKNLDRIWEEVGSKQIFTDYIENETREYLGDLLYD